MNRHDTFVAILDLKPTNVLGVVYPYIWPRGNNGTRHDRLVLIDECQDGEVRIYVNSDEDAHALR